jgi:ABC-type multidrug transport system ATPase subunit
LEQEARGHDQAAADDKTRAGARTRRDRLKNQKKLCDDLPVVLARFRDLDERRKLQACSDAVDTGAVSRQITALRRSLVMNDLETRILEELKELALTHIPFAVSDRSEEGQSYFEVVLDSPKAIANKTKVLSEGEQRALALACFLAEVGGDKDSKHGLIIDDPVTSLDHTRIRRVAARLVREAANGRQVIIFTHNLHFFNEIIDAAAQRQVSVVRNYFSKSETAGFGVISETDEPWIAQPVTKRIATLRERLKTFEGVTDFASDDWRRKAKDFYSDLRETWERLVEELLLGKVVERFNSDVRTQSLKGAVIEDDDYKRVYWAMKHVSERSGHDMAVGKAIPTPTTADMKADLDVIDDYRSTVQKRKNETTKRREALEKPPAGTVR